ncbi:MAG: hypothetical protein IKI99_05715 [Firmicutes bacterium]|nr:hypothetical protein [Bacillota bacterium]
MYRATSEKGKYSLIKTTTASNYTDTKALLGKKYYYKVKAVKKNGRSAESSKKSFTNKLPSPVVNSFTNENLTGSIQISWKPVKNASKYSIYRAVDNNGKLSFKYVGWTKKTTYTDKKVTNPNKWYAYKIRAVYSKNTNGNSLLSESYGYFDCRLAAPSLSYVYDEAANVLKFSWNKPAYAGGYTLSYIDPDYGYDNSYGFQTKRAYTLDVSQLRPGTTYEFFVRAYKDEYDYYWNNSGSVPSKTVKFTVPGEPDPV